MKHFTLLIVTLAFSLNSIRQVLKGQVLDTYNEPSENVYVVNKALNIHAHTNGNGSFTIEKTTKNNTIEVSTLGFEKKTIQVTQNHINKGIIIKLNTKIFQ